MKTLLLMMLAACTIPEVGDPCPRINAVECLDTGEAQCVCDFKTCNPGDPGVWAPLDDAQCIRGAP